MPNLTYWKSLCRCDSNAYSIRAKTLKAVLESLKTDFVVITQHLLDTYYGDDGRVVKIFIK